MRFAPEQAWRDLAELWYSWPEWLRTGIVIALVLFTLFSLAHTNRKVRRNVTDYKRHLSSSFSSAQIERHRYLYLKLFQRVNEVIAWLALLGFGGLGMVFLFIYTLAGILMIAASFLFFAGMIVWTDAVQLFIDIEAHLRALRNELPSAIREVASTGDDKRRPSE